MSGTTPALTSYVERLPSDGEYSLWVGPLDGPATVQHNAGHQHYAASTMKLALVIAAYRRADAGTLDLGQSVIVHDDFESAIGCTRFSIDRTEDSDEQTWRRMGERVALRWLANRAIVRSGNLATNLLLESVGLPAVAETLEFLGAKSSTVARGIEDAPAREAGHQNLVTAEDLALTLRQVAGQQAASPESCREVLATLAAQQINDAIPVGVPPGTKVAHKSGWVQGISHDAGIVFPPDAPPYVLVVCTTSTLAEQESLDLIAAAAAASWQDRGVIS
ncbi:MAG: beta-lactamase class [Nocardioidaceae bacterium]|jgi:beta-lactamase class A|nr:beta-lactamase class [Nocardioidaceae bacterium]